MDEALLDTDTLSEIIKGKNASVAARASAYRAIHHRYTFSVFTALEIMKGYHRVRRPDRISRFLAGIAGEQILTFGVSTAELSGRIIADLELSGRPIGRIDPMIAAVALEHGLTVVTGNVAHYQHIQRLGYPLTLDDWRA